MSVNNRDFRDLLMATERALRHFESRPPEAGFDREVYDELRRVREMLVRGRRDLHDPNLKRKTGSRSPRG